jgi:hypothetical protein
MRRIRIASILLIIGLLIELFSLRWHHALSFVLFFVGGGLAIGGGILFYLHTLLWKPPAETAKP